MSDKSFHFRPIQKSDNPHVAKLLRTVMTEFNCIGEGYSIMDKEVDEMWETYINDRACFYVLTLEGEIVGCGGIGPLNGGDETICELKKMYFYPAARGQGMGKEMVKICLETAKNIGYQTCYLETVERMEAANKLYEKMGFQLLKSSIGCTGHEACDRRFARAI